MIGARSMHRALLWSAAVLSTACGAPTRVQPVNVAYAGSLVAPMEGPVRAALDRRNIRFLGDPAGSAVLAHLIAASAKNPDVFISADPSLVTALGNTVAGACVFAGTRLGVAWLPGSRFAATFDAVAGGRIPLKRALEQKGLTIGRTDPRLDPKGRYTIAAMRRYAGPVVARRILGAGENPDQTFPEQDLAARLETAQTDVGFFYETEAAARNLRFYAIPAQPSGGEIRYAIAVLRAAPHFRAAAAFEQFVLGGEGRTILSRARLRYVDSACVRRAGRRSG
jgi:molybdate/tungstate transport system substrate-binding protein